MRTLVVILTMAVALAGQITPELEVILEQAGPSDMVGVIVQTRDQADMSVAPAGLSYDQKLDILRTTAVRAQQSILEYLATVPAERIRSTFLVSRVCLRTTPAVVRALAAREDVDLVFDDHRFRLNDPVIQDATDSPAWNVFMVKADSCWAEGYTGAGVVVGNIDTGVEVTHPAFGGRWRTENGWFDAVNGESVPYDDNGHGTHVMGTMCGGDGLGPFPDDIGIAPGATFICAKGFDDNGTGTESDILECFDWMAAVGRPDVLSNSWCRLSRLSTTYFPNIINLINLGIKVVFAIGNSGPSPNTSYPPGSYPNVISAGAVARADTIAKFSSRGPAPDTTVWRDTVNWLRPDWNLINPTISAPGVNIRSAAPGGGYQDMSGTSMACPHVAGCVALMLQKAPHLSQREIFNIIADHADHPPAGEPYPNNNYGWGRLNCKQAVDYAFPANRPNLLVTRTAIADDPNRNYWLDPGESAKFLVFLRNASGITATNLVGVLHTTDPYVSVADSVSVFGDVAGGDSTRNQDDPFGLLASVSCPPNHVAELNLTLTCSETSYARTIRLTTGPPRANPGVIIWGPKQLPGMPDLAGLNGLGYDHDHDRLYVTHHRSRSIYIYSSDSNPTLLGTIPTPNNETACTDIKYCAYDSTFWIASGQTKRVYKMSVNGTVLRQFANPAANVPTGLAWDESSRLLYLADRRSLGMKPGYVYVTDALGNRLRQDTIPLNGNYGARGLALDLTNTNPDRPSLLMAYTYYNVTGQYPESTGLYEFRNPGCRLVQYVLSPQTYDFRGVEYDPRDGSMWATVSQHAGQKNIILKYAGFHLPTGCEVSPQGRSVPGVISILPNPCCGVATVTFQLAKPGSVQLAIRDAAGRELAVLVSDRFSAGKHQVRLPDLTFTPGVYFLDLKTFETSTCTKLVHLSTRLK
ncbi:MAG: S8 family serine peptidase [candidate division WOR-3 bacterium]